MQSLGKRVPLQAHAVETPLSSEPKRPRLHAAGGVQMRWRPGKRWVVCVGCEPATTGRSLQRITAT